MTGSRVVTFRLDDNNNNNSESGDENPPMIRNPAFFNEASPNMGSSPLSANQNSTNSKTKNDGSVQSAAGSRGGSASSSPSYSEAWRKYGKLYRAKIIMDDEENGGNTFVLSDNCRIERYYAVAEKVLRQFLSSRLDANGTSMANSLREAYLVGNRLVKFLSTVLPTHPDYFKTQPPEFVTMRSKSQAQLVQLLQYLEQIALLIDEDQYNKYILQDLHKRMSSTSLQDTTLSSIELASTSDTSFSSIPLSLETNTPPISTTTTASSQQAPSSVQRPPRVVPEHSHPERDFSHRKSRGAHLQHGQQQQQQQQHSPMAGYQHHSGDQHNHHPSRQAPQEVDIRMQQHHHSTSWDVSFSRYHGHPPPAPPRHQGVNMRGDVRLSASSPSSQEMMMMRRIHQQNDHARSGVHPENWTPQFPPMEDINLVMARGSSPYGDGIDHLGQQASTTTTATTASTNSNSSAASSLNPTTNIEQRWIQAQQRNLQRSRGEHNNDDDSGESDKGYPKSVKELEPWQATSSSSSYQQNHHLPLTGIKRFWPTPKKKNISYYAAKEGDQDEEAEVDYDEDEAYLAGAPRPGEDEASLTSSIAHYDGNNLNNGNNTNSQSRRTVVLKQFKGCVNCLVN